MMVDTEHRRWVSYSRSEGMQYISPDIALKIRDDIGTHVDIYAQLSPCLISTEKLKDLYKILYSKATEKCGHQIQGEKTSNLSFYERVRFVVRNIYRIQDCLGDRSSDTKI